VAAVSLLSRHTGANILLVVNRNDSASRQIADYCTSILSGGFHCGRNCRKAQQQ